LIDADAYLIELLRYIHRNPIKTGIVARPESYQWSSHKGYLSTSDRWRWLDKDYFLKIFSNDKREAIRRYRASVNKEVPEVC